MSRPQPSGFTVGDDTGKCRIGASYFSRHKQLQVWQVCAFSGWDLTKTTPKGPNLLDFASIWGFILFFVATPNFSKWILPNILPTNNTSLSICQVHQQCIHLVSVASLCMYVQHAEVCTTCIEVSRSDIMQKRIIVIHHKKSECASSLFRTNNTRNIFWNPNFLSIKRHSICKIKPSYHNTTVCQPARNKARPLISSNVVSYPTVC